MSQLENVKETAKDTYNTAKDSVLAAKDTASHAIAEQTKNVKASVSKVLDSGSSEEGATTAMVEEQTSKLPSLAWMGLAVGSMAASAAIIASSEKKDYANFVGMWAPCFLLIGIYNKLVKLEESDRRRNSKLTVSRAPAMNR